MYMYLLFYKQNRESTEGYSKSIVRKIKDKFGKELVSTRRTYASPKRTGPGVRRSKRPLSACPTHCKCSMETSTHFKITCIHESIWNTDTVSFNLDRKYLYFDQNDYKIGERLSNWELIFLKSRSSLIRFQYFVTLTYLLLFCYTVISPL